VFGLDDMHRERCKDTQRILVQLVREQIWRQETRGTKARSRHYKSLEVIDICGVYDF
jgi:hypothetical protein